MNFHYDYWVGKLLQGQSSWTNEVYTAYLVSGGYSPVASVNRSIADIPASAILAQAPVENRAVNSRYMLADNLRFDGYVDTTCASAVVIADSSGALSHYIGTISGLDVSSDGSAIEIVWADCGISSI